MRGAHMALADRRPRCGSGAVARSDPEDPWPRGACSASLERVRRQQTGRSPLPRRRAGGVSGRGGALGCARAGVPRRREESVCAVADGAGPTAARVRRSGAHSGSRALDQGCGAWCWQLRTCAHQRWRGWPLRAVSAVARECAHSGVASCGVFCLTAPRGVRPEGEATVLQGRISRVPSSMAWAVAAALQGRKLPGWPLPVLPQAVTRGLAFLSAWGYDHLSIAAVGSGITGPR